MDGIRIRELASFTGKGLGVAFADFEIPICFCHLLVTRAREHGMVTSEDRFLTCLVESACTRWNTVWEPDHLRSVVAIHGGSHGVGHIVIGLALI